MQKTILIISTDATRTGTPVLLLETLKWLKSNSDLYFVLIFNNGGELLNEFRMIAPVYVWSDLFKKKPLYKNKLLYFVQKITEAVLSKIHKTIVLLKIKFLYNVDIVYCNTARNGHILLETQKYFKPSRVLTHIHEGEKILALHDKNGLVSYTINKSNIILTVSQFVKQTLIDKYNVLVQVHVVPGAINPSKLIQSNNFDIFSELEFSYDSKILLCCGWLDWHKGSDSFIHLASKISKIDKRIKLVWLGGSKTDETYLRMIFDVNKLGLFNTVKIVPSKGNPFDYFLAADIFLMLSREESFSLVTIEAGFAKKPVLCFDGIGGPCEILNNDPRFIVPYLDIDKLCSRIIELLNAPKEMKSMGDYLYNRVINNYLIDVVSPEILKIIHQNP